MKAPARNGGLHLMDIAEFISRYGFIVIVSFQALSVIYWVVVLAVIA